MADYIVSSGVTSTGISLNGQSMHVLSGGVASKTSIENLGEMHVSGGGVAKNTILNEDGFFTVFSGGVAEAITINQGGDLYISSGGVAANAIVNPGGEIYVSQGGSALAVKENGGYVKIWDDTQVSFLANSFSGLALNAIYQSATLHSGTTATETTIGGEGRLYVYNGGMANKTSVGQQGYLYISSGGIANNTGVESEGSLYVSSGGVLSGTLQIAEGANVCVYKGAVIDFTVAEQKDPATALISDWSMISGRTDAGYTLTVSEDMESGDYILAGGAADFSKTITVKTTDDTQLGELSVNGGEVSGSERVYSLRKDENLLVLNVLKIIDYTLSDPVVAKYDGTAKSVSVTVTDPAAGAAIQYSINGKQTWNAGSVYSLTDAGSAEVCFKMAANGYKTAESKAVSISIAKRDVTLTTNSGSKKYDGTALQGTVETGGDKFVAGEATASASSITDAGSVTNAVTINKGAGYKESNYNITKNEGTLTVTKRSVTLTTNSGSKKYDGTVLQGTVEIGGDKFVAGEATASASSITDAGSVTNAVTINKGAGYKDANYNITKNEGTLTVTKRSVTLTAADKSKIYDGTALTGSVEIGGDGFVNGEATASASNSITNAGSVTNTITINKISGYKDANYNIAKNEGTLTVTKRDVTLKSANLTKEYDGTVLLGGGSISDLTAGQSGKGYVSGEEFSYTFTNSRLFVGSSNNTFNISSASASTGNYNTEMQYGTLTVTGRTVPLTITVSNQEKIYDGTLDLTSTSAYSVSGALASGDTITVTLCNSGNKINAGNYADAITATYKIMHGDVDVTDMYLRVNVEAGDLKINKRNVTVASAGDSKVYDGTSLVNHNTSVTSGSFVAGEGYVANVTGSRTAVGTSSNTFTVSAAAGTNLNNYNVTKVEGTLEVTKILTPITITAGSDSKMYDGTALSDSGYTFTPGVLIAGDELTAVVTGSITDAGSTANKVTSYKVMRGGVDVTNCYTFADSIDGTLTVTKRNVTLTSANDSKVYDGTPLTNSNICVTGCGFVQGEGATYNVTGSRTEIGSSANTFDYALNSNTKAQNYNISKVEGTLTVTAPFTVKSDLDGNTVSDVMFQWTGGDYQIGFWMNGTSTWQGTTASQPKDWELLGNYDMDANGNADQVMFGNVVVNDVKGAYIGYYKDGDTTSNGWVTIGYLDNSEEIEWHNVIGNLTGNEGKNSIVWHAPELGACGVWTDGTTNWVGISGYFDSNWELQGCGDFDGNGKDEILWKYNGELYTTDINSNFASLGNASGWDVRAIGDFSGDGKDDIVLFHSETGSVMKYENGQASQWSSLGQLDAKDWFIVGAGDYNGDAEDDLLVRQYSSGMLGYYEGGDMSKWVELGRGVDMNWTVIA